MTRQDPIRVMLADDENLIRGAIRSLLALEPDIDVVADAASGPEAVPMAGRHRPDVAVLDLIVTSHGRPGYLKRVLAAGESPLTPRESDVLELAARPRRRSRPRPPCPRARSHCLSSAVGKLGTANRHEPVQIARRHGWI